jgi:hypothetical protein
MFVFLSAVALCFVFVLQRLVYAKQKHPLFWIVAVFIAILLLTYLLNPNNRVYSFHGFIHAGIVYEILNGNIPPSNPFLAQEALHYPWGYHLLAAGITWICHITPFYAFMIINIISLLLSMVLVFKISSMLIKDTNANVLSLFTSIFGITVFCEWFTRPISGWIHVGIEERATPAFLKFFNVNGVPLGLVFFLLFLLAVIRIFRWKKPLSDAALLAISILGVAFFYPAMLFSLCAATACICPASWLGDKASGARVWLKKVVLVLCILIGCIAVMLPYFDSISAGLEVQKMTLEINAAMLKSVSYIVLLFPVMAVIFLNRRQTAGRLDRSAFVVTVAGVAGTFLAYACMNLPERSEYKALLLSAVMMGILGGPAFAAMKTWCPRIVVLMLLLAFAFPSWTKVYSKTNWLNDLPVDFTESGRYICIADEEEDEMHRWIQKRTSKDSVFIDTELTIPVFASRRLFIGPDKWKQKGFKLKFLRKVCRYDPEMLRRRHSIVKRIYNASFYRNDASPANLIVQQPDVYIVVRNNRNPGFFERRGYRNIFRSSLGHFMIYQMPLGR